jgi:hypothetical protein
MPYDYSDAPPPRDFELIPANTIATLRLHIQGGGAGEDGMLKRSKDGRCEMLALEFVVVDGEFAKRKLWENWIVEGVDHAEAIKISHSRIKAVIDSALGLDPKDVSPQARAARTRSYKDLEGLTFLAKIGIEKGGPKKDSSGHPTGEFWSDKNIIGAAITKDKKDWHPVTQPPPFNGCGPAATGAAAPSGSAPSSSGPPIARPGWAGQP